MISLYFNDTGDILMYPEGDTSVPPSAMMPRSGSFLMQSKAEPIVESDLKAEDNLEEFTQVTDHDLNYWKKQAVARADGSKGVIASLGGTALGDIALVPAINMKNPKGIRGVAEWYISTVMREEFVKEIFDRQTDIAIENLKKINAAAGEKIDTAFICGTDFGTQSSTFCSPDTYARVWMPYYKKVNDWIHANTSWKTFNIPAALLNL